MSKESVDIVKANPADFPMPLSCKPFKKIGGSLPIRFSCVLRNTPAYRMVLTSVASLLAASQRDEQVARFSSLNDSAGKKGGA